MSRIRILPDRLPRRPKHSLPFQFKESGIGIPTRRNVLIEKGVLTHLVYNRRNAQKFAKPATGHGMQEPSAEGEWPVNFVVAGGNTSLEEMISSTKRGVLLTRRRTAGRIAKRPGFRGANRI